MTTEFRLLFKEQAVRDAAELIGKFTTADLASPYRSTVPLLALAKDDPATFGRILGECGMAEPATISFEYEVHSESAIKGRPSCTDAMAVGGDQALAIEAKWTEPRYPTVARRLVPPRRITDVGARQRETDRQREFIEGWLPPIGRCVGRPLRLSDFSDCVYQMVHRAASACSTGTRPALAYLHFSAPHRQRNAATSEQYREDLTAFHRLLGRPDRFPFFPVELTMTPTAAFREISDLRPGAAGTGERVREALLTHRLFDFGPLQVCQIVPG